jgi:hypothetical protein
LKLQPGDRKALPRMPMVEIKERKRVRVVKAPLRAAAGAVSGVGLAIRSVGQGVAKLGDLGNKQLGKSAEWVPEGDVVDGKKVDWPAVFAKEQRVTSAIVERTRVRIREAQVFNEKGQKLWKDDDSDASTTHADGHDIVEEKAKEFC